MEDGAKVSVVIYIASETAEDHIKKSLSAFEPEWKLRVIQRLPKSMSCNDSELNNMCIEFFDKVLVDRHKKQSTPFGYKDIALPLVLYHNTPNNSISVLWATSTDRKNSLQRHALFTRYERHHVDRP